METLYKLKGFKDLLKRKDLFALKDAKNTVSKPESFDLATILEG